MSAALYGTHSYLVSPSLPTSRTKAIGSFLDYLFDFTQEFSLPTGIWPGGGSPGDYIIAINSLSASPSGSLTVGSGAITSSGNAVSFWASGGSAGQVYIVTLTANTAAGRTYSVSGLLPVGFV